MKLRWRFGVIAGICLAVFCLYPQMKMVYNRGSDWNGHYAYNDIDEVAYASYLRALIDDRPRKNDPYSGRDHSTENPSRIAIFDPVCCTVYGSDPAACWGSGHLGQ